MCLAVVAFAPDHRYPWVIASNRDEYFDRAALAMDWWRPRPNGPPLLAGRDLSAGGTWLGLDDQGRLALVTNVREPGRNEPGRPSRGDLAPEWLGSAHPDAAEALQIVLRTSRNGFNLMTADLRQDRLAWTSNRAGPQRLLTPGVYGLSNAALDTPWPKVVALKQRLVEALADLPPRETLAERAFEALSDPRPADDDGLPDTGVPLERERQLSPAFIRIAGLDAPNGVAYGTRCSTVIVVEGQCGQRQVWACERTFDAEGNRRGEVVHRFDLPGAMRLP
jgi:uncharacterized protein with NRDE domain